jgi:acyl carrier protein
LLEAHVRRQLAGVLGLDPARRIPPDQGFFDLGMDSLLAMELRNRLQASCAAPLPSTLGLDYPSVAALVRYLSESVLAEHFQQAAAELPPEVSRRSERLAALDHLSEDELAEILENRLIDLQEDAN